jgi:peptide/nickel transport system substrate-binding protein
MKVNTKRVLALLLTIVLAFALASCGGATGDESAPTAGADGNTSGGNGASARDTLTVAVSNDSSSLDPIDLGGGASFKDISRLYAEPLFDIKQNGEKLWILATGYEEVTPTQWIVHIREGVTFTNGNPFTAEDALFSLRINNTHPIYAPSIPVLDLETSRVIDDYTLELNFSSYDLSVVNNIPTIQMYDAETYDPEVYTQTPVGTGPYVVSEYVINSHCYLTPNPGYWGTPGKIQNLKFKVINEPAQIVNALTTGTVDAATVPSQDVSYVDGLDNYQVLLLSSGSATSIWFNTTTDSVFGSLDARLAAVYAINRQSIADLVYFGLATLPDWPLPTTTFEYGPEFSNADPTYANSPDLELAKQYAEKAGLVGKTVRIMTNGASETITMAEIFQQSLNELGAEAEITNYDAASSFQVTQDTTVYDVFFQGLWVPSNTAAQHYYGWYTYMPSLNQGVWEGKERFAELAEIVMGITDEDERYEAVKEMTEIFVKAAPWFALVEPQFAIGYNKDLVTGEYMAANNTYYSEWYWAA